jgi:DNA-binding GntR family transcriptional regulator
VREISVDEARDLYDMRGCLEAYAGRMLAPRITDSEIHELRGLAHGMEPSFDRQDVDEYYPRNMHFHDRIIEMTQSQKLIGVYRKLMNEIHLISRRGIAREGGRLVSNGEHQDIVTALAQRDPVRAEAIMSEHVYRSRDRFLSDV